MPKFKHAVSALTVDELGTILYEEFDRDGWGTVDPSRFRNPPSDTDKSDDNHAGLREVLERVTNRINAKRIS